MKWPIEKLGNLAEFKNGINYSASQVGAGVPVYGVSNFQNETYAYYDDLDEVDSSVVRSEDLLKENDVLFVRSNGNRSLIGRSVFIRKLSKQITHSGFTIRCRFISSLIHPRFYAYVFKTKIIKDVLIAKGGGTNINNLNQKILSDLEVPLPPINVQRRISEYLEKFDRLIELNTQKIVNLEKVSLRIYKEWFVNFKFPDHEKVKMVDSGHPDFGMIPHGWRIESFANVFDCRYGKNLPTSEISDVGQYPVYGAGGIIGRYNLCNSDDKIALITSRGNGSGDLSYTSGPSFVTNNSFLVTGKTETAFWNYSWNYFHLTSVHVKQALGGAAQPQLTLDGLSNLPVMIPDSNLIRNFQKLSKDILDLIITLKNQNTVLAKIRDLLLPKLISGEIDVSELSDINVENLAAKKSDKTTTERTSL